MEINDDNYGPVLTELVSRDGRGVKKVCEKAGIRESTLRFWMHGTTTPSLTHLSWVLEALGYRLEVVKK